MTIKQKAEKVGYKAVELVYWPMFFASVALGITALIMELIK